MHKQDDSQQNAELRQAFLRHLPKRLDTLTRRGLRQARDGWDINTLSLIFREVQTLAGAGGRYGMLDLAEKLYAIETALAEKVEQVALPDEILTEHIVRLLEDLQELTCGLIASTPLATATSVAAEDLDRSENGYPLQLVPPADYWKRFPASTPAAPSNVVPLRPAAAAAPVETAVPAPAVAPAKPQPAARNGVRKVYHLTDGSPLACEVDQKLELSGYELSLLDHTGELIEVIGAIAPHLVVVDAHFLGDLERIGELVKAARNRASHRVAMLAMSELGDLDVRLRAMRAGADAFVTVPAPAAEIMARIAELTEADQIDPYRVLIVEDDRSQAIFAESILRKAGMHTTMVTDPLAVLDQLDHVHPDLILMDLYMPGCSGMELTSIIREREAFVSTPIVFLSGEHDADKHFEALNAGGDDFLSKPIRPKHLISAVTNRLRRARHIQRRSQNQNPRDPVTGLYDRAHVLDRINAKLASDDAVAHRGGLTFVDLDQAVAQREQVGLIEFDRLLGQVGTYLAAHVDASELIARFGDSSFIVLSPERGADELRAQWAMLRERVSRERFDIGDRQLHVNLSFGVCPFATALGDAGAMLNAAERAMSESRRPGSGNVQVFLHKPTGDAALVEEIRAALRGDSFHLVFQPIAALQSEDDGDSEEQFQALLRLRVDGGRILTASDIVPVAEQAGLIDDVDRWVLSRCLMVLSDRSRQGRPVRLFTSQSGSAVRDPSRVGWLRQQIETRRIEASRLVLELRMPADAAARDVLVGFAAAAQKIGVGLCLSGLEPGESAHTTIDRVPTDYVKLAPNCMEDRAVRHRDELRRLVHHAHECGRRVIAPRIEDAQSAAMLWTVGVDFIQGNFVQHEAQNLDYDFRAAAG